ncbi:SDR family NAD(P)-dependent oxidoreductase [Paenibacillus marinisediminis]
MKQPTIWIVGAGCGIGLGIAKSFGKKGYTPILVTRNSEILEEMIQTLASHNIEAHGDVAFTGDEADLNRTLQALDSRYGTPDVLVYNASSHTPGYPSEVEPQHMIDDFKVNVVGALITVQSILPGMKQRGSGTVLLTGGGQALNPSATLASLGVGKAGLRSLALSLHEELKAYGLYAGTLTVSGFVQPNTPFNPDMIGDAFYHMHKMKSDAEVTIKP